MKFSLVSSYLGKMNNKCLGTQNLRHRCIISSNYLLSLLRIVLCFWTCWDRLLNCDLAPLQLISSSIKSAMFSDTSFLFREKKSFPDKTELDGMLPVQNCHMCGTN
jgi:hypothetical protein